MPNSELRYQRLTLALMLCFSFSMNTAMGATAAQALPCHASGTAQPSREDGMLAGALQRQTESAPLYTTLAAASKRTACQIRHVESGVIELDYRFQNQARLHVLRNARIEHTEVRASFNFALKEPAETILARAERASFGANGCAIDWRQPEAMPVDSADKRNASETVFRGAVCNCQARIRRNANGRVIGLMLASAC